MPPRSCQCAVLRQQLFLELLAATRNGSAYRSFSSTSNRRVTRQRRQMFNWLNGPGAVFRDPLPGSTNYLSAYDAYGKLMRLETARKQQPQRSKAQQEGEDGDAADAAIEAESGQEGELGSDSNPEARPDGQEQNIAGGRPIPKELPEDFFPFPANKSFRSQSVLSEDAKDAIYADVVRRGMTVREVSEKHNVDIARIGAVVRLKAVEEEWNTQGRPLATPYARAVLAMLPQTQPGRPHETINDLPVHAATTPQLFYPASESRQFTRADAGEAFQLGLLPADARIPHPQMVRALIQGDDGAGHPVSLHPAMRSKALPSGSERSEHSRPAQSRPAQSSAASSRSRSNALPLRSTSRESLPTNGTERAEALRAQMRAADAAAEKRARAVQTRREEKTTTVPAARCDFRFEHVAVDERSTGRFATGVGYRYGVPAQDRKKGLVKIPTKVE